MLIKNFIIASFIFFSANVHAKNTWIIKNVQFSGLHSLIKNELLKKITWHTRKKISENDVKNSIRSLFTTGYFEDIKAVYVNQTIIFYVKERPIISKIDIIGNKTTTSSFFDKYLNHLGIIKGHAFNPFMMNIFTHTITSYYKTLGKYQSQIKIVRVGSFNNTVHLKIMISEGASSLIKSIQVIGNKAISNKKIISFFYSKCHSDGRGHFQNCFFSNTQLTKDLNELTNFYLNKGYIFFHVNSKKIDFSPDKKNICIKVYIHENEKYKISDFLIHSNSLYYNKRIKDIIHIQKNELYNKEKIDLYLENITKILSDDGYIHPQINIYPQINHVQKTMILNLNIDMQKRYIVHQILFEGNTFTKDSVLRREMLQKESSYVSRDLIELGKKALEKTKYFSSVQTFTRFLPHDSDKIDIIYKVIEKKTGSLNFGMGYGRDNGISANIVFSQDNVLGFGNSIKSQIIKNNNQKYIDINIIYPYISFHNINLDSRMFYDEQYNINTAGDFKKNTYGIESNVGLFINDSNKVNFGLGYTHDDVHSTKKIDVVKNVPLSSDQTLFKNTLLNDYTMNYAWIHDNMNYVYYPISGNKTSVFGKNTLPGSDNNFYKFMLDSVEYIPLTANNSFICFAHMFMGAGNLFNIEKLPLYERFYSDNLHNIRGFQANTIGPKNRYYAKDLDSCTGYQKNGLCESVDSTGGNAMIVSNLELFFPIPIIEEQNTRLIRTSLFLDVGGIWDVAKKNKDTTHGNNLSDHSYIDNIYASSGIAFRWFSPIGPLVFSYAYPIFLQKNQHYQIEPFQFNMGKDW